MNRFCSVLLATLLGALSADAATIRLYDGTTVRGDIVRFEDGTYTIRSESLGTVHVDEDRIEGIDFAERKKPAAGAQPRPEQILDLQREMVLDASLFSRIQELRDDPQIQAALQDPVIARAMASGNYAALLSNEKFLALLQHPEIQAITRAVLSGQ